MSLRGALDRGMAFASARLGNGVPCHALDLFVYERLHACRGEPKPRDWAAELSNGRDGDDLNRLTDILGKIVTKQVPIWRTLEVI